MIGVGGRSGRVRTIRTYYIHIRSDERTSLINIEHVVNFVMKQHRFK